ncbi:hypothetical protein HPB52_016923 [Rhipicephalus sanguineus]|uniref:NIDO domain-containing protein n=1 Tax=Rhipicephalus sanguineus TaxID=34632 RepID=A0A9D4T422_RHISA|nr:hypothetical protein HPB52_016923 [Rhipicephalus sanguineus]
MYPYDRNDLQPIDTSKLESEISLQARLPFFGFHYKYIKKERLFLAVSAKAYVDLSNMIQELDERAMRTSHGAPQWVFPWAHPHMQVHLNGYLHFSGATGDVQDTIREKDPALIAPWLSYQSMVEQIPESGVYFRLFRIGEHYDRDPEQWLERRAIEDFREGMIGAADFRPTFVAIATWRNVTLTGMQSKNNVKVCPIKVYPIRSSTLKYADDE